MSAKEYLQQIYAFSCRINFLQLMLESVRIDMSYVKEPNGFITPETVISSEVRDDLLRLIAKLEARENQIVMEMDTLIGLKRIISDQVEGLADERFRDVLRERYVYFRKWEDISDITAYRLKWVYELHTRALLAFEERYKPLTSLI